MVNHCVTIRTNWLEIVYRIYLIRRTDIGQGYEMMDMDDVLTCFAVTLVEAHVANRAAQAMMGNAFLARTGVRRVSTCLRHLEA
jgi:hypothetical protein